jgi:hypothetical protein
MDGMAMVGDLVGLNKRIHAGKSSARAAFHAPESIGGAGKQANDSRKRGD